MGYCAAMKFRAQRTAPASRICAPARWRAALACLSVAVGAAAGGLPVVGALPVVGNLPATVGNALNGVVALPGAALSDVRNLRIQQLVSTQSKQVELDPNGNPIVRAQLVAISPAPALIEQARSLGFTVLATQALEALDLTEVVLQAPPHWSTRKALKELRQLDPSGTFDFNHIYLESGEAPPAVGSHTMPEAEAGGAGSTALANAVAARVGLIDAGVDVSHPVFQGTQVHRHGCADAPVVSAHGTAVASLLSGEQSVFSGAAPHAELYAADVYCGQPTGGAVTAVAEALAWMVQSKVPVINLSLVGPSNATLAAIVRVLVARGFLLVAAVGNDGPSAPALYPASYAGVVGVTAVDARRKVLLEAGRGPQVHFAAPGADMLAAAPGGTFAEVRGTSFAAPIVAGLLARDVRTPDPLAAASALDALNAEAVRLGSPQPNPIYGYGLVGESLRTPVAAALPHGARR
jgi:hypothetical protein